MSPKRPTPALLVSVLLITGAIAVVALWGRNQGIGSQALGDGPDGTDRYQALLDAQARQDERMDRLELMLARMGDPHGSQLLKDSAPAGLPSDQHMHDEHASSPAQDQSRYQQAQRKAEAEFSAEPVVAAWASRHERIIVDALSTESLKAKGSPKPRAYDAQCRRSTCRIELIYADEGSAEEAQLFLLSDIAGALDKSRPFRRTLPDGSVHLVMYSTSTKGP